MYRAKILAAAYALGGSSGCCVWNQTAAAQLDKAITWGDVTLTSPKTVVYEVAQAKHMGMGDVYVYNLQDDLCVPDLAQGIMLEASAETKFFNAKKLLQLLVVGQQQNDSHDDTRDE